MCDQINIFHKKKRSKGSNGVRDQSSKKGQKSEI